MKSVVNDEKCSDPCGFVGDNVNSLLTVQKVHPTEYSRGDIIIFLESVRDQLAENLKQQLSLKQSIKWYVIIKARFQRKISPNDYEYTSPYFRSNCMTNLPLTSIDENILSAFEKVKTSCEEYHGRGSGWILDEIMYLELKIGKYEPLAASTYFPLPRKLQNKHAVINVQNTDRKCFLWSILAALHPAEENAHRVAKYIPFEKELDVTGIDYPVSIVQVAKFEKNNKISVNLFGYEKEIFPLYITTSRHSKHINLLLLSDGDKRHYCLIRNVSRLLSHLTEHDGEAYYCNYCLQRFTTETILNEHQIYCHEHNPQKVELPSEDERWLKFKEYRYQMKVPYVIYADFESVLEKVDTCFANPQTSHTMVTANHQPCGFSYLVVGPDGRGCKPAIVYRGENAIEIFLQKLLEEEQTIEKILKNSKPMKMTSDDENKFENELFCHICNEKLINDRVKDHDHLTGRYRGAAHNACNLQLKFTKAVPIVMHNLKNYDSHLIMQGIGKFKDKSIHVIPNNMEKYISFSLGNLWFIDSYQFMSASLETLVNNLPFEEFKLLKEYVCPENIPLLLRKGVYPYEYVDSPIKFEDTELPARKAFYSQLSGEELSLEDYRHAQDVRKAFNVNNLGEYHDLYVKSDTLLLADVFENFRKLCMTHYTIDPCHLYTAPGLAWNACLKMTKVKLELITDSTMYLFVEKGVRGGISMISNRFSHANNKYLNDYNSEMPTKHIVYLDANNLYAHGMSQFLPQSDFRWLSKNEINSFDVMEISDTAEKGYFLEVDLDYPKYLHDEHNDYPLAPENILIGSEMFSPYMKDIAERLGKNNEESVRKLAPNLRDKEKYILHYRNLKQYLSLGMTLRHIHRILEFSQSPWLKNYIDFNTEQRKLAKNSFEKDFFKLMNNSVFGKTMENLRHRVDIKLVHNEKKAKRLLASPAFHAFQVFNNDLVGFQMKKKLLKLNRPIYVGFSILDISKILMYDFHYNYIKKKYTSNAKLLLTDTDSLCYEIKTEDIYEDMLSDFKYFDTSDYPEDHFLFNTGNKKVLGKMKDEMHGDPIQEFVGLRAKMYSIKSADCEKKTAKGVVKSIVKKKIAHVDYRNALLNKQQTRHDMPKISTNHHQVHSVIMRKISLCPFDDKRYILCNGCDTLAYGHYKIFNNNTQI